MARTYRYSSYSQSLRTVWLRRLFVPAMAGGVIGLFSMAAVAVFVKPPPQGALMIGLAVATFGCFSLFAFCLMADARLLGKSINRTFRRVVAQVRTRELVRWGWRGYRVRLAGEVNDGSGTRAVEIIPGTELEWSSAEERDRFLESRIRPDGTCDVALDPLDPGRVFLLPWGEMPIVILFLFPIVPLAVLAMMSWMPQMRRAGREGRSERVVAQKASVFAALDQCEVATEDGRPVGAEVLVKSSVRLPPNDPSHVASRDTEVAKFTVSLPASVAVPPHAYPDGQVYLHFFAPGYARQWTVFEVKAGHFVRGGGEVKLWRNRYAVVRYAFNRASTRNLKPDAVEAGRIAVTHWSQVPNFAPGRSGKRAAPGMFSDASSRLSFTISSPAAVS
jgi:hypothetical protein